MPSQLQSHTQMVYNAFSTLAYNFQPNYLCTIMSLLTTMLLFIFFLLANLIASVDGQYVCGIGATYTSNSTYQTNLNTLLSTLSRNIDQNGFYNASIGESPDTVNALVLCRGDLQLDTCRSCVQNATNALVSVCPNQRQATYWSSSCMLRYSRQPLSGTLAISPVSNDWIQTNVSNHDQFNADLRILIESLRGQAALGSSLRKVAAGGKPTSDSQTIYALVQCTPDLAPTQCTSCLTVAAQQQTLCCSSFTGARILMPSCNLRYDVQLFFNESRLLELDGLPPSSQSPMPGPIPPGYNMPPTSPTPGNSGRTTRTTIIVVSVSVSLILLILVGFLLIKRVKQKRRKPETTEDISLLESLQYEFDEIKAATDGFSEANKLGQGGFGVVYGGKLLNGQPIAVKRLSSNSLQGDSEFKNEVQLLAKLQHRNLVRLLGFSQKRLEKLLVYEFLQNSSLDKFIFDSTICLNLNWDKRYKIILGIARGLLYLHEDSRLRIIHRDLKASNILLDEDMNPKIADFGIARLFLQDETRADTDRVVGTLGYMAPEYAMHGQFSVKSDVFSYGVLVLEIISGQKNSNFKIGKDEVDLLTRAAWRNWHEGTPSNLISPILMGSSGIENDIVRCIHIGLLCVQQNPTERPKMASVVSMLDSFSSAMPAPSEPAYFFANNYDLEDSTVVTDYSRETYGIEGSTTESNP